MHASPGGLRRRVAPVTLPCTTAQRYPTSHVRLISLGVSPGVPHVSRIANAWFTSEPLCLLNLDASRDGVRSADSSYTSAERSNGACSDFQQMRLSKSLSLGTTYTPYLFEVTGTTKKYLTSSEFTWLFPHVLCKIHSLSRNVYGNHIRLRLRYSYTRRSLSKMCE